MAYFKIVYKTTEDEFFELTIPNAYNFINTAPNILRVNQAAQQIISANAIDTNGKGDLVSIQSITFNKENVTEHDISTSETSA